MCFRLHLCPAAFRLQLLPFFLGKHQKFRLCSLGLRISSSRFQSRLFIVFDAAHFFSHDPFKDHIDQIKHLFPASEILMKIHTDTTIFCAIPRVFFQEKSRLCLTEPVDTLFHISYHKPIIPPSAAFTDTVQDCLLHQIGILVFIYHNFCKIICKQICSLRRNQLPIHLAGQYFQCQVLLICKIQNVFSSLFRCQPFHKGESHLHIGPYQFCCRTKLGKLLL